jgi:hypothetical protein
MLGLTRNGVEVDPCNWALSSVLGGVNCASLNNKLWYSGDPVTQVGWIYKIYGDVRQLHSLGYFKLVAGETVEVLAAYIAGRGEDALSSITVAKNISERAQSLYNANFDTNSVVGIKDHFTDKSELNFQLSQNYPNPFNPSTKIKIYIPSNVNHATSKVVLKVFDVLGREVETLINEDKSVGMYAVEFSAKASLSNGVYFYRLQAGNYSETKKMILMK